MTTSQRNRRHAAAAWRATCRAAAALRAIHAEQALMWELLWQSNRVAVDRTGPLAWTPSLDGPRLTESLPPDATTAPARGRPSDTLSMGMPA